MSWNRLGVIAKLAAVLLAAGILMELATRSLVFWDAIADLPGVGTLRQPHAYAHPEEDLYWTLRTHLGLDGRGEGAPDYHSELGWTAWPTETLEHPRRQEVAGRRPILLYGDSFSACLTSESDCFQGLLDRSPLGKTHALVNYGVNGYGLDQIAMLLERSIDHYLEEDPVVIVGLLVDADLDRAGLSYYSGRSKPRMERLGGTFACRPPLASGTLPPIPKTLLGLRLTAHSLPIPEPAHELVCGRRGGRERNKERCRAIFSSVVHVLERRGIESFFLLFHREESLHQPVWEDALVTETLDDLGARWVSTREHLLSHALASGRATRDYYDRTDHLSVLGNSVAFRAIREGLAGSASSGFAGAWTQGEVSGPLHPSNFASTRVRGRRGVVRYQLGARPEFPDLSERSRLFISVGRKGPTEVTYDLDGRASSFSATARFFPTADDTQAGRVGLTFVADGQSLLQLTLSCTDPPRPLEVDLTDRETLTVRVDDGGDGIQGDWLVLTAPRFATRAGEEGSR